MASTTVKGHRTIVWCQPRRLEMRMRRMSRLRMELESIIRVLDREGVLIATVNPVTRVRTPVGHLTILPTPAIWSNPMSSCSALLDADETWMVIQAERVDAAMANEEVMQAAD